MNIESYLHRIQVVCPLSDCYFVTGRRVERCVSYGPACIAFLCCQPSLFLWVYEAILPKHGCHFKPVVYPGFRECWYHETLLSGGCGRGASAFPLGKILNTGFQLGLLAHSEPIVSVEVDTGFLLRGTVLKCKHQSVFWTFWGFTYLQKFCGSNI